MVFDIVLSGGRVSGSKNRDIIAQSPPVCNQDNKIILIISHKGNPLVVIRVLRHSCQNIIYLSLDSSVQSTDLDLDLDQDKC